jgi:hypothetical protein
LIIECEPPALTRITMHKDGGLLLTLLKEEYEEHLHKMKDIAYQKALGSLMYVMVAARPDLAFAVTMVSRIMSKLGPMHWMAVK